MRVSAYMWASACVNAGRYSWSPGQGAWSFGDTVMGSSESSDTGAENQALVFRMSSACAVAEPSPEALPSPKSCLIPGILIEAHIGRCVIIKMVFWVWRISSVSALVLARGLHLVSNTKIFKGPERGQQLRALLLQRPRVWSPAPYGS